MKKLNEQKRILPHIILAMMLSVVVQGIGQTMPVDWKTSGLSVYDLQKQHKQEMKQLKQQLNLKEVKIVAASDDYWYYSLKDASGNYGAANQQGKIVVSPQYKELRYSPVVSEDVKQIYTRVGLFNLCQQQTSGAFMVYDGKERSVLSLDGQKQADMPAGVYEYYNGYYICGAMDGGIEVEQYGPTATLMAFSKDNHNTLTFMTSDGKVLASNLVGLSIDSKSSSDIHQPLTLIRNDDDGIMRCGGMMLDQPSATPLPTIFGMATYDHEKQQWMVQPCALENAVPYDPVSHTAIAPFSDEGERLYYQGKYNEAAQFYASQHATGIATSAHDCLYQAAAIEAKIAKRFNDFASATEAFEDINSGNYAYYYNDRFKMRTYPENDLNELMLAKVLITNYTMSSGQAPQYTDAADRLKRDIATQTDEYQSLNQRYDYALNTLDQRIADMKEAQRREAEEQAAREAEQQQFTAALFNYGYNMGKSLGSSFASAFGGSSSRRTTTVKNARKSGSLNIDNSSVAGKSVKDLPHTSSSDDDAIETASSSSSSSKQSSGKSCHLCYGTGKCRNCDGKGWHTGFSLNEHVKCGNCNQTGKCSACGGTGKRN